jgi:hypothetical protein
MARVGAPRRRAFSIIYVGLTLFLMLGIVSLAVDMGRVRVARVQLTSAADASALASALDVRRIWQDGTSTAQTDALTVASENVAIAGMGNAVPVILTPGQDVELGLYRAAHNPPTFTRFGSTEPGGHTVVQQEINAVHVIARRTAARGNAVGLFFAQAIGLTQMDVTGQAIAIARGTRQTIGLIGLDWVILNGTTRTDSYNAAAAPYGGTNVHNNGSVASNGSIDLVGTVDIYGDARPGVDSAVSTSGNPIVHGWTAPIDSPLYFPPKSLPPGLKVGPFPTGDVNLTGGSKKNPTQIGYSDLIQRKKDVINISSGYVEIYVTGSIDMEGGANTNINALPEQLTIYKIGTTGTIDVGGGSDIRAHIYAPQSDIRFHGTNTGGFYGWLIGKSLTVDGNSQLHYDESLPNPYGPPRSVLVK